MGCAPEATEPAAEPGLPLRGRRVVVLRQITPLSATAGHSSSLGSRTKREIFAGSIRRRAELRGGPARCRNRDRRREAESSLSTEATAGLRFLCKSPPAARRKADRLAQRPAGNTWSAA